MMDSVVAVNSGRQHKTEKKKKKKKKKINGWTDKQAGRRAG